MFSSASASSPNTLLPDDVKMLSSAATAGPATSSSEAYGPWGAPVAPSMHGHELVL